MVPEGWKLTDLGGLGKWSGGGTPSKSEASFWMNGCIPWISPKDMWVTQVSDSEDYITEEAIKQSSTKLYPEGSVLVVTRSGILRKRLPVAISTLPIAVNQDLKVFAPQPGVCTKYLANFMWCFNDQLLAKCAKEGTTVESIDTLSLLNFPIKLPPLGEQKKIAQILSAWDKATTTTEQLLANSQQQKKALMQQLLTDKKRLPGFSGEWRNCHLSDVAVVVMGSSPKSEAYNDDGSGLPLIQGNADIKNKLSAPRIYTSEITKECAPEDILLSVRAPVGSIARSRHRACIGRGISAIKAKPNEDKNYLYQWLLWFEPRWISLSQGSTFESINSDDIKSLKIAIPCYEEQQKIAAVLSSADQEIEALQQKLDCLKQEKKSLMQQLLTGKRRVKIDNKEVA